MGEIDRAERRPQRDGGKARFAGVLQGERGSPPSETPPTCYAGEDLADPDEHVLGYLPPDEQVGCVVRDPADVLADGTFRLDDLQPLRLQDSCTREGESHHSNAVELFFFPG